VSRGGTSDDVASCEKKCGEDYTKPADLPIKEICVSECKRFKDMYLIGIVSVDKIVKGETYRATLGGLRNPRAVADGLEFTVTTYDPEAFNEGEVSGGHIIDEAKGGGIDIDNVSPLTSFSAIGKNTTNGDEATFIISWFTEILT